MKENRIVFTEIPSQIFFEVNGKEIARFDGEGNFYWNGQKCQDIADVYSGLKEFVEKAKNLNQAD